MGERERERENDNNRSKSYIAESDCFKYFFGKKTTKKAEKDGSNESPTSTTLKVGKK